MSSPRNEMYNLRWNSYSSNLINVFTEHQRHESLVDVTLSCEGKFIKAHRLVLSACSVYFQKIFENNTSPQLVVLFNDVKFNDLELAIQFMYKGEVKVADCDLQDFLSLGKMLNIKGLCSVELKEKSNLSSPKNQINENEPKINDDLLSPTTVQNITPEPKQKTKAKKKNTKKKTVLEEEKDIPSKKRRLSSPVYSSALESEQENVKKDGEVQESHIQTPHPPSAFMIFATQWRKKLAVEYPYETNKDISKRLGIMWKNLPPDMKETFYEDAKKAEEEHYLKYPK